VRELLFGFGNRELKGYRPDLRASRLYAELGFALG
jgi:hypothetical protein